MTTILEGNPDQLESKANGYMSSAQAILEAAEELSSLVFDHRSAAVDEVSARTTKLAAGLKVAHTRYTGTASALKVYSVELRELQRRYRAAENEVGSLENVVGQADAAQERLKRTIRIYEQNGAADNVVTPFVDELRRWQQRDRNASELLSSARGASEQVEKDYEAAAKKAIAAIDTAIREGRDTLGDKFRKFVEDVRDAFVNIAKWVAQVVKKAIDAIVEFVKEVWKQLVAAFVAILMAALAFGLEALGGLLGLLGVPPELRATLAALLLALAVPVVGLLIMSRIIDAVGGPTPQLYAPGEKGAPTTSSQWEAKLDGGTPGSAKDLIDRADAVDRMGGEDASVVDIKKVVGPDGVTRWIVTLPSTQDWVFGGDKPADNDLDVDLALMLTPGLRTRYERAVLDAMAKAGIEGGPNGDPVMVVGFSLGGIMAGHLAANRSNLYNFDAVLTVGSPIDAMPIPPSTKVVSVQHVLDSVHRSDFTAPRPRPNWTTIVGGAEFTGTDAHNAQTYAQTLGRFDAKHGGVVTKEFSEFLGGETSEQSTQYVWSE